MEPIDMSQHQTKEEPEEEMPEAGVYEIPIHTNKKLYPFHWH
jgi:hypothetical protein